MLQLRIAQIVQPLTTMAWEQKKTHTHTETVMRTPSVCCSEKREKNTTINMYVLCINETTVITEYRSVIYNYIYHINEKNFQYSIGRAMRILRTCVPTLAMPVRAVRRSDFPALMHFQSARSLSTSNPNCRKHYHKWIDSNDSSCKLASGRCGTLKLVIFN